jgi:hypothetical protein
MFPVPPMVIPKVTHIERRASDDALLECTVEAWPRPLFYWQKDGHRIEQSDTKYVIVSDIHVHTYTRIL